jgi:hypothetical protein
MKSLYALSLLSLTLLLACKEDEPLQKCESVEEAPQDFLDYWFFPEGSYYVYKLRGEERHDTMVVDHITDEYYQPYDHHSPTFPCTRLYTLTGKHSDPFFLISQVIIIFNLHLTN